MDNNLNDETIRQDIEQSSLEETEIPVDTDIKKSNNNKRIIIFCIIILIIVGIFVTIKCLEPKHKIGGKKSSEAVKSTLKEYVGLNEWTKAAKSVSTSLSKSYKDTEYVTVPVRVTKVTRGTKAEEILNDYIKDRNLQIEKLDSDTEWVVFDYEIDLNELTFDENTSGTEASIKTDVVGLDGKSVKYKNTSYIMITYDVSENNDLVTKKGIYKKRFILPFPIGCKDYIVTLGDGNKQLIAYIKPE